MIFLHTKGILSEIFDTYLFKRFGLLENTHESKVGSKIVCRRMILLVASQDVFRTEDCSLPLFLGGGIRLWRSLGGLGEVRRMFPSWFACLY